jgi:membrane protease YdiL (CAAX protease family)
MEIALESPTPSEPSAPAIWGPVATLLWAVLVAIVFILAQSVALVVYLALTIGRPTLGQLHETAQTVGADGTFLAVCTFVTLFVCTPLIIGIAKLRRGSVLKEYLGLRAPSLRQLLQSSALTLAFYLLTDLLLLVLKEPIVPPFMQLAYRSASPRWILWLAVIVAAPVLEEIFFRGFVFKGLAATRLRWIGAVIITAGLWAAIHLQYDWVGMLVIFGLGLLLGTVRAMTGSTPLTIWLHGLVNFIATVEAAIALGQI